MITYITFTFFFKVAGGRYLNFFQISLQFCLHTALDEMVLCHVRFLGVEFGDLILLLITICSVSFKSAILFSRLPLVIPIEYHVHHIKNVH